MPLFQQFNQVQFLSVVSFIFLNLVLFGYIFVPRLFLNSGSFAIFAAWNNE